ncbi:MAG: hypothetical protein ACXVBT_06775, partial [Flavisolibacter sp.]
MNQSKYVFFQIMKLISHKIIAACAIDIKETKKPNCFHTGSNFGVRLLAKSLKCEALPYYSIPKTKGRKALPSRYQ